MLILKKTLAELKHDLSFMEFHANKFIGLNDKLVCLSERHCNHSDLYHRYSILHRWGSFREDQRYFERVPGAVHDSLGVCSLWSATVQCENDWLDRSADRDCGDARRSLWAKSAGAWEDRLRGFDEIFSGWGRDWNLVDLDLRICPKPQPVS